MAGCGQPVARGDCADDRGEGEGQQQGKGWQSDAQPSQRDISSDVEQGKDGIQRDHKRGVPQRANHARLFQRIVNGPKIHHQRQPEYNCAQPDRAQGAATQSGLSVGAQVSGVDDKDRQRDEAEQRTPRKILAHALKEGVEISALTAQRRVAELDQSGESRRRCDNRKRDQHEADIRPDVDITTMLEMPARAPPDLERRHRLAFQAGITDALDKVALEEEKDQRHRQRRNHRAGQDQVVLHIQPRAP